MSALTTGDLIFVSFGGFGEQLAIVAQVELRWLYVFKWRERSQTWTKRVRIARADIRSTYVNKSVTSVLRALEQLEPQLGLCAPALKVRP